VGFGLIGGVPPSSASNKFVTPGVGERLRLVLQVVKKRTERQIVVLGAMRGHKSTSMWRRGLWLSDCHPMQEDGAILCTVPRQRPPPQEYNNEDEGLGKDKERKEREKQ
jgi:hypothetical protein